jgi:hypothetical protein
MKSLMLVMMLSVSSFSFAGDIKMCAVQANETCKEYKGDDFKICHETEMLYCLSAYGHKSNTLKSNPICMKYCSMIEDRDQRNLCYTTCSRLEM